MIQKIHPEAGELPVIQGEVLVLDGETDTALEEDRLTVCIDAGHGGKDNGSDYRLRYEKNDNLKIAQAVAAYLTEQEVQVIMTRSDDTFLSLEERTTFANEKEADYFVSLHRNTGDGNGVETWIGSNATEETEALA
ncbi:MAG: N-acetylmuramoyl-L-alanine amidase, partial [Roseburia sp.]|nr:N-acetylmuramoyl-L-alanine amidase [Roseburia sp.]